ncbi:MAG: hypothetical protein PHN31_03225 [Candidatus Gracilibacteria bacterium]|nr:hypothetical protein [Candidatus Gracilibacteria bacterium]
MKKLAYLVMGYLAGSTVSSLYSSKKGKDLKKDIKKAKDEGSDVAKKVFIDNFIETQKSFFQDLKSVLESDDSKKYINSKKDEVLNLIDKYKDDSELLIQDLKSKGKVYAGKTLEKLEEFYKEKKKEGEQFLKSIGGEKDDVCVFKDKLSEVYEELKAKLKK